METNALSEPRNPMSAAPAPAGDPGMATGSQPCRQRSGWTSPLVLAVWATAAAITGNAWVAYSNGQGERALERLRTDALVRLEADEADATLALRAIGATQSDAGLGTLRLLRETGILGDPARRAALANRLDRVERGPNAAVRAGGEPRPDPLLADARIIPAQYPAQYHEDSVEDGPAAQDETDDDAAGGPRTKDSGTGNPQGSGGSGIESFGDPRLGAWANSKVPAKFGRFTSGLKVGDAVVDKGDTGKSGTWLGDIGLGGPGASWDWMARARVTSLSTNSLIGGTFAERATGKAKNNPIGLVAAAVADSPNAANAWGIYSETMIGPDGTGGTAGAEFDTVNASKLGAAGDLRPYGTGSRGMTVLNLAAGGDASVHGPTAPISAFATLRGNGAQAKAGLVFKSNALRRSGDPDSGYGEAVSLPEGYGLSWYGGGDQAEVFRLYSTIGRAAHAEALSFRDDGMRLVQGFDEATAFHVPFVAGAVNYVQLTPAAGGHPAAVAARGGDKSIDLRLDPKGGGAVDFGTDAQRGTVKPTYRALVKFNGVAYYVPLDPA